MGGNLFKLGRLPKAEYLAIEKELRVYLDKKFGTLYRIPRYFQSKADFGDVDIILSTQVLNDKTWLELKEEIIQDLQILKYQSTGTLFSTVYRNFQVDYFIRSHQYFESTYAFLSFNDLGNLIGKICRRFNLKYGEEGLVYVFRRADQHYKKEILISLDFEKIYSFLKLDYQKWLSGFETREEMFDWIVASPYFSIQPYMKLSTKTEKRAKERTTIKQFLIYLEKENIQKEYQYLEEKTAYVSMIDEFFPEAKLVEAIEEEKALELFFSELKAKYNGQIIMQLFPELRGKELGTFIQKFQEQFEDYEKELHGMSPEEIIDRLKFFYKQQQPISLETDRLILMAATSKMLEAALQGDEVLGQLLSINIPGPWSGFGTAVFPYTLEKLKNPEEQNWWMYLVILKTENALIGTGGYKGAPTEEGMVEIAYEIAEAYRQRGLATEVAEALIEHAIKQEKVLTIWAHTLAENNASTKILENCGFIKTKELHDEEDGDIWRWEHYDAPFL